MQGGCIIPSWSGDNGKEWKEDFAKQAHPNIRYIFPSANMMSVSLHKGMELPSWFDIKDLTVNSDQENLFQTRALLSRFSCNIGIFCITRNSNI